jgi:hypothetical protein
MSIKKSFYLGIAMVGMTLQVHSVPLSQCDCTWSNVEHTYPSSITYGADCYKMAQYKGNILPWSVLTPDNGKNWATATNKVKKAVGNLPQCVGNYCPPSNPQCVAKPVCPKGEAYNERFRRCMK